MKILSKNTEVLSSSLKFNDDNSEVIFQANTNLFVEGNPYEDLFTSKTIFDLVCKSSNISNILEVAQLQIDAYILANGSLNATTADGNIAKIIKEKYIANYGVALEPWNDWRRTGYPTLQAVDASVAAMTGGIPRSLFYPDSEVSANTNFKQKANMLARVFWDTRP